MPEIKIGEFGWKQIGGDMDPGTYGGTIAMADGSSIELLKIQPVREHVGDAEAAEVGHPFWTREGYFTVDELNPNEREVRSAMDYVGLTFDDLRTLSPEDRATAVAEALLDYGRGDEGPAGWAKDILPHDARVKWWGSKRPAGWRYLEDEDREFRQMLKDQR